jgi:hypothetical protein
VIVVPTESFPLRWPQGIKRSPTRHRSAFKSTTIGAAVDDIFRQLRLMKAKTIVISSNLTTRADGTPSSDGPMRPNGDPGVAVYWTREEHRAKRWQLVPYCMPCDRWDRISDNLHALALSIEAMRGMERWGAVSTEQAFAGFAALPAGSGDEIIPRQPSADWRTILGGSWPDGLAPAELLGIAKARHRKLIATAHPDQGGSTERAAQINAAIEAAEQELKS